MQDRREQDRREKGGRGEGGGGGAPAHAPFPDAKSFFPCKIG